MERKYTFVLCLIRVFRNHDRGAEPCFLRERFKELLGAPCTFDLDDDNVGLDGDYDVAVDVDIAEQEHVEDVLDELLKADEAIVAVPAVPAIVAVPEARLF